MDKILVSKCLLGENVKYNGGNNFLNSEIIKKWQSLGMVVPICPECDGGLPTPRPASEIRGDRVINCENTDVTECFERGALEAVQKAVQYGARYALMKQSSPSCGSKTVYDGTFSGTKKSGMGIAARKLREQGVLVFDENQIEELDRLLRREPMEIPQKIRTVLETLNAKGYEAYNVGGCVRDYLMGSTPSDYDITTNALPEEVMECFSDFTVVPTGLKHGTVTVVAEGENIEITTYRVEGAYSDNRHPDSVSFTRDIEGDLSRRDFTMNAIAMDIEGNLRDPFGGADDIRAKRIVCVGDADKRFGEDGLRILRGVRFASVLGFDIEKSCEEAIHRNKKLLGNISRERIYTELSKLVLGKDARKILTYYNDIIFEIIPGIDADLYSGAVQALSRAEGNIYIRLALLLGSCGSCEGAVGALHSLKCDNRTVANVKLMLTEGGRDMSCDRVAVRKLLSRIGFENYSMLVKYNEAYFEKDFSPCLRMAEDIRRGGDCITVSALAVDGTHLAAMGMKGAQIGATLKDVLQKVMEEKLDNSIEEIVKYIKLTESEQKL